MRTGIEASRRAAEDIRAMIEEPFGPVTRPARRPARTMAEPAARSGRRVLVTGAGGGIGRAIAQAAAGAGAAVGLLGRTRSTLEELAGEVAGDTAVACADVSDPVGARGGRSASWPMRSAGSTGWSPRPPSTCAWAPTGEIDLGEWDRTIATNLSGAFYSCRFTLPHLVAAGGGSIVNITSVAGSAPGPRTWPTTRPRPGSSSSPGRSPSSTAPRASARTAWRPA